MEFVTFRSAYPVSAALKNRIDSDFPNWNCKSGSGGEIFPKDLTGLGVQNVE